VNSAQLKTILTENFLLEKNDTVVVGCSAGPDSTALLSLLCECNLQLTVIAVYIDHGLRSAEEIRGEKDRVRDIAEHFGIGHEIVNVDVRGHKRRHNTSLEESARILRYAALERCRLKYGASVIAVAHTADDQAEEILLRLFRGTGLKGLSGMAMKNATIIRPLLCISKNELLEYLESSEISYRIDSSNADRSFLRNRLRLDLLPRIREYFNPAIHTTLLQTAAILREDDDLLERLTLEELSGCTRFCAAENQNRPAAILDIGVFLGKHLAVRRRIMEKLCWKFEVGPHFHHIEELIHFAEHGGNGAELHLPQGLRIYKSTGRLTFEQPHGRKKFRGKADTRPLVFLEIAAPGEYIIERLEKKLTLELQGHRPQQLPEGDLLVDGDKAHFPLILRTAEQGERFTPLGMKGTKKISRFLADLKIPRRERFRYPVLASEEGIVAVVGLRIDDHCAVESATTQFLKVKWRSLAEKEQAPAETQL
jgi:tRNA(Ile)-lysidine synthase